MLSGLLFERDIGPNLGCRCEIFSGAILQLHIEHAKTVAVAVGAVETKLDPIRSRSRHESSPGRRIDTELEGQRHLAAVDTAVRERHGIDLHGRIRDVDPGCVAIRHARIADDTHASLRLDEWLGERLELGRIVKAAAVALNVQRLHGARIASERERRTADRRRVGRAAAEHFDGQLEHGAGARLARTAGGSATRSADECSARGRARVVRAARRGCAVASGADRAAASGARGALNFAGAAGEHPCRASQH